MSGTMIKIRTEFVYPPIPDRRWDWSALDDATYDGPGCPIGSGATEAEAIADLLEQLDIEVGDVRPLVQRKDGQWLPGGSGATRTTTDKPTVPFADIAAALAAIERYRLSAGQTRIRDQFTINIDAVEPCE